MSDAAFHEDHALARMTGSGSLLTAASLIAGEYWRVGAPAPVLNPHNAREIAEMRLAGGEEVDRAVEAARDAQADWAATPAVERGAILHKAANILEERAEALSEIVAVEAGKLMRDARGETAAAILCARFFAGEGQRLFGRTMPTGARGKSAMTVRQPCGVAALITAANTPAPNFAWKVFPALICGDAVVLKPAEDTPLSADFMARILIEAGVPAGALNVVQGLGADIGPLLTAHPSVDVISFTGSTRVGRMIAEQAGRDLKKVSLELGGKNAFVVCDDADLDKAVEWASVSAFSNAGQRCASASRIIVMDAVYDAFAEKFVERASSLRLGVSENCDLGPVINARQLDQMLAAVSRAEAEGARVLTGGKRADAQGLARGFYLTPTVIDDVDPNAEISRTELFGPIAVLYRALSFKHALAITNASPYGLTACVHTTNWNRAWTFTREASVGVAVVNGGTFGSEPHMPFGGLRASGNGTREPGAEALDVYTELKDVYLLADAEAL
ncbi:MAG: aldehyde dehydrogenase family protein [Parvularculaceae bacterium]